MAVFGRLDFGICHRDERGTNSSDFVDVCGKVVATYKNTFGSNYKSQEFVLFNKNPDSKQYQRLRLGIGADLLSSSRCWLAAPAFSLLHLRFDLFDSEKKPILTQEDIQLETDDSYRSCKHLVSGDYLISVSALWLPPNQPPPQDGCQPCALPRQPSWDSAIEVFSVLVCPREEYTSLQIHGHLQFTPGLKDIGVDIFKREKENPLTLLGRGNVIPAIDGSRQIDGFDPLSITCDLKNAVAGLSIKGYESFNNNLYYERQLCSIFRGDLGFVALHYSFFSSAVQANLTVSVYPPKGSQCAVFGSICARYKYFDYSSRYKKNCCRIVLFNRSRDGSVQMDADGPIPLSRTSFIVPSYSSIFDLDLMTATQKFSDEIEVPIGINTKRIIMNECEVEFVLEWGDVK